MLHFWCWCILCDAFGWWQISYDVFCWWNGVEGFRGSGLHLLLTGTWDYLASNHNFNFYKTFNKVGNVFERPQFKNISIIITELVFHSIFSITILLYDDHRALESFTPCVQCASLTSRRIFQMQASDMHHQLQMHLRNCISSLYSCHSFQHLLYRSASTDASVKHKTYLEIQSHNKKRQAEVSLAVGGKS